jgi:hypothetical protein
MGLGLTPLVALTFALTLGGAAVCAWLWRDFSRALGHIAEDRSRDELADLDLAGLERVAEALTPPKPAVLVPTLMPDDWSLADFRGTYAWGYRYGLRVIPDGRGFGPPPVYHPTTARELRGCQDATAERGIELRPKHTRTRWRDPWSYGTWVFRTVGSTERLPPR